MNLWVLFLCRFFVHSKAKNVRVFTASFLAAIGQVMVFCIPGGRGRLKLILGFGGITAMIVAWLFRPEGWKYYYKLLISSYMSALSLGGVFLVLENILGGKNVSFTFWGILVVFIYFIAKRIYVKLGRKNDFCKVVLFFSKEESCELTALVDSGNGLIDPISKTLVSIVEEKEILSFKKYLKEEKIRLIPFHSVGNKKGILEAYFIDKMEIRKDGEIDVINQPMIAITKDVISVNERYQMILHPELVKQGGICSGF